MWYFAIGCLLAGLWHYTLKEDERDWVLTFLVAIFWPFVFPFLIGKFIAKQKWF